MFFFVFFFLPHHSLMSLWSWQCGVFPAQSPCKICISWLDCCTGPWLPAHRTWSHHFFSGRHSPLRAHLMNFKHVAPLSRVRVFILSHLILPRDFLEGCPVTHLRGICFTCAYRWTIIWRSYLHVVDNADWFLPLTLFLCLLLGEKFVYLACVSWRDFCCDLCLFSFLRLINIMSPKWGGRSDYSLAHFHSNCQFFAHRFLHLFSRLRF